jgi:hypothetical protein
MIKKLLILAIIAFSCESGPTGVEYTSRLPMSIKVEIQQHGITAYKKPGVDLFIELPPGKVQIRYTPSGCWTVILDTITIEKGCVYRDSLWFAMPLWN